MKHFSSAFAPYGRCSGEVIETDSGDAAELFEQLNAKYGFSMGRKHVRLAVNDAFVDWDAPLNDGDQVVFIPPVAGG
jgi:molybdopterin synthase sulfur carrier subunit